MKHFAFVNEAARKEYLELPSNVRHEFGKSLRAIQQDHRPYLAIKQLKSIGAGVIELKINGSPAYRCVYIAKYEDTVFVLHTFEKTTNGVDRQAMKTLDGRYKELRQELKRPR